MCNNTNDDEVTTEIIFSVAPANVNIDELKFLLNSRLEKAGVSANNLELEPVDNNFFRLTFTGKEPKVNIAQLLETTGKLTVYSTWNNSEIFSYLNKINSMLGQLLSERDTLDAKPEKALKDTNRQPKPDSTMLYGKKVTRQNGLFDILQPATTTQNGKINMKPGPVIGYIMPVDTQVLRRVMQMDGVRDSVPRGLRPAIGNRSLNKEKLAFELIALRDSAPGQGVAIAADDIKDVNVRRPESKKDVTEVQVKLNKVKSEELEKLHKQYPDSYMAIAADDKVIYYWRPSKNDNFSDVSIVVSGTETSAKEIAAILENPMPYKLTVHSVGRLQKMADD